jgi:hypothetical protein
MLWFRWGRGQPEEENYVTDDLPTDISSQARRSTGQILWIRGLTRLQTQGSTTTIHNTPSNTRLFGSNLSIAIAKGNREDAKTPELAIDISVITPTTAIP